MTIHKRLNAASEGGFHLNKSQSGCCPDDGTTCRYSYTYDDDGTTLVSIVVDGTVVALNNIDPTGELSTLIVALQDKLEAAGFTSDDHISITAWRGDDSLTIDIFATVVFGDLVVDPAATITADVNCVATPLCYWELEVDVSASVDFDLEFGKIGDLVGGNIAGDYSTGNSDTLDDDIAVLFDGLAFEGTLLSVTRVKAVEDLGKAVYNVGIWGYRPNGGNLFVDGEMIEPVTCSPNYSQAE